MLPSCDNIADDGLISLGENLAGLDSLESLELRFSK